MFLATNRNLVSHSARNLIMFCEVTKLYILLLPLINFFQNTYRHDVDIGFANGLQKY